MAEQKIVNDMSGWFSTYGLITAKRILDRYRIKLTDEEALYALKTPHTFYNRILRIPLKNVFNGIIMQQVKEYQIFAQKLFIDYLLSGEDSKVEEAPGGDIREQLESYRQELSLLNEEFHQTEQDQEKLIAESQSVLIKHAESWLKKSQSIAQNLLNALQESRVTVSKTQVQQAFTHLLLQYDLSLSMTTIKPEHWKRVEQLLGHDLGGGIKDLFQQEMAELTIFSDEMDKTYADYLESIEEINLRLRNYRNRFSQLIIRVNELLKLLPEYSPDDTKTKENREQLYFNKDLGEKD